MENERRERPHHECRSAVRQLAAALLWLGPSFLFAACERDPAPVATPNIALGAVDWIPADAAYFSSTAGIGSIWGSVLDSRAMQALLSMPAARMALAEVERLPLYRALLDARAREPLVRDGLEVLADAVASEVFFYADSKLVAVHDAVLDIYGQVMVRSLLGQLDGQRRRDPPMGMLVPLVLEHADALRMPPIVAGFRLRDPQRAKALVAALVERYAHHLPLPLARERIGDGDYHTMRLGGDLVPPRLRDEISASMRAQGVTDEDARRYVAFVVAQTVALSIGFRGDYLLVAIGADTEHLARLGTAPSLGTSTALAPVRQRLKPGLCELVYVHERIVGGSPVRPKETTAGIVGLLETLPAGVVPDGLLPRLRGDLLGLLEELDGFTAAPRPWVMASFVDRGIETFTFSAWPPGRFDASRPLSLHQRAGEHPVALLASRSPPLIDGYRRLVHWMKVGYGYFEDFAVPRMPPSDRSDFERLQRSIVPAIAELDRITAQLLLPAIDGAESCLVFDAGGKLAKVPGTNVPLAPPIPFPHPAWIVAIRDAERLVEAGRAYRDTINRLLGSAAGARGNAPQLPAPTARPHAGGTAYEYRLPTALGLPPEIVPHVLVTGDLAVFAIAPGHSQRIVESTSTLPTGPVPFDQPAGAVAWVDVRQLTKMLVAWASAVVAELAKTERLQAAQAAFVGVNLQDLARALAAVKTYAAREYCDGDLLVRHAWLEIEDTGR